MVGIGIQRLQGLGLAGQGTRGDGDGLRRGCTAVHLAKGEATHTQARFHKARGRMGRPREHPTHSVETPGKDRS